jgi:hypothetical protein
MRITRRQLRRLIKEMAWDPKSSPYAHPDHVYTDMGETPRSVRRSQEYQDFLDDEENSGELRAYGLQSYETSEREKQIVRDYHEANSEEIKKFHAELQKPAGVARVTCLHSIEYEGMVTGQKGETLSEWINNFGTSGRDQLSTVMFPGSATELFKYFSGGFNVWSDNNVEQVMYTTSLIMSGYPTMMNYSDMMTQTRGSLHPDLVKFQAGSGVSKSTGTTPDIDNFEEFLQKNIISEETVLDNWGIKGVHCTHSLDESFLSDDRESFIKEQENKLNLLIAECQRLRLPLWVTYVAENKTVREA